MASALIFVRHAETALKGTFCGRSDPELNAAGRAQLGPLVERLGGTAIDAIYTSDRVRARATAEAIAKARGVGVTVRAGLGEIDFGEWEGLTWEAIEARDPEYAARWVSEFPTLAAPGGEAIALFKHRVMEELAWLERTPETSVAVVTHAGVLRVLLEELGHLSAHHAWERTREYTCVIQCRRGAGEGYWEMDV